MTSRLLWLLLSLALPLAVGASHVEYREQSLHEVTLRADLIVVAKRAPVPNSNTPNASASDAIAPNPTAPEYFEIERVLVDREKRGVAKKGDALTVFDASRALNESLGELMQAQGLTAPPYSPVVPRYRSSLSEADYAQATSVILFLVTYKDQADEFLFAMDRAYESPAKAREIIEQMK